MATGQSIPASTRAEAPSPVAMAGGDDGGDAWGWAAGAILVAALFLLLANAQALDGWADEQVPSETMVRVTDATESWLAATEQMGVAAPRARAHALWKRAQAVRFTGQVPAEP